MLVYVIKPIDWLIMRAGISSYGSSSDSSTLVEHGLSEIQTRPPISSILAVAKIIDKETIYL
jgi:hypothetical protein